MDLSKFGEGLLATVLIVLMAWSILLVAVIRGDASIMSTIVTGILALLTGVGGFWFGSRGQTSTSNQIVAESPKP